MEKLRVPLKLLFMILGAVCGKLDLLNCVFDLGKIIVFFLAIFTITTSSLGMVDYLNSNLKVI